MQIIFLLMLDKLQFFSSEFSKSTFQIFRWPLEFVLIKLQAMPEVCHQIAKF